jgi:predicted DsbA family dithiol-disulfide isomerase
MRVDVWSDVVCPWCYIGKRRLESALESFPHRDDVEVVYHSFQLDPSTPRDATVSITDHLASKYGVSADRARQMQEQVRATAEAEGLDFRMDGIKPENTLDAHRLLHLAKARGRQAELKEALLDAHFTGARRVGQPAALQEIAVAAGLDAEEVAATLADPSAYATDVGADIEQARRYGIRGVPFFVIDQKYGISGAQPAETLTAALSRAWMEQQAG